MSDTPTKPTIDQLIEYIGDNCKAVDVDELYNDMLDECYSFKCVGGPFAHMQPHRVLENEDPTAYRCGKVDYLDSCELTEVGDDQYEHRALEDARDEYLEPFEEEAAELEEELEAEDLTEERTAELKAQLASLEADILTVKRHAF